MTEENTTNNNLSIGDKAQQQLMASINNVDKTNNFVNNSLTNQNQTEVGPGDILATTAAGAVGLAGITAFDIAASTLEVGKHAVWDAPGEQIYNLTHLKTLGESKFEQPSKTFYTKLGSTTAVAGIGVLNNLSERFLKKSFGSNIINNISKYAGRNSYGFAMHVDYAQEFAKDVGLIADGNVIEGTKSLAKHTIDEAYETQAMNRIIRPLWSKFGGLKVENGLVEGTKWGVEKTIGKLGNFGAKTSNFLQNVIEIRDTEEVVKYYNNKLNTTEEALNKAKAAYEKAPSAKTEKAFNKANSKFEKAFEKASEAESKFGKAANTADDAARAAKSTSQAANTTSTAANATDDVARAAANTADDAANVLANSADDIARGAQATTAETQAALKSTTILTKCGTAVSKISAVLNNPIVSKSFGILGAASGGFQIYSGITDLTKDTTGMSSQQVEELHSGGRETIVKGAVGVAAGVLMFTPVGWVAGAGAAVYMGADYLSEKMFGKSISSAIGDGVASAYDAIKEDPSKLLYATPLAPVKAVYDAYNYFFGDDEEPAKKVSAPAIAIVKVKPTPPKDLLKAMNLDPEKDKNKYSYEINNDVLKIQLEVNKKIKEVNKDLPNEHDLKALSCDGKLGKQTLLKMHELGLDDEALKITGLRKQAYNELIDLSKKAQYSTDPKQKEEAAKLADIHMKRINSKENYGKAYSSNDVAVAVNSIKDKKINPLSVKANLEKSKQNQTAEIKGRFDVSNLIPESMRNIPAESTSVEIPFRHVEREFADSFKKENPANVFTRGS